MPCHGLHSPGRSDSLKSPSPTPSHSSTLTQSSTGSSVSLAFSIQPSSMPKKGNSQTSVQPTQSILILSIQPSTVPEEGNSQTSFQPTQTVLTSSIQPSTLPEKDSDQPSFTTVLLSALVAGVLLILIWIAIISYCLVRHKKKNLVSNNEVLLQSFNTSTDNVANQPVQNYYISQPFNHAMQRENSPEYAMPYQHIALPVHPDPDYQPVQDD